MTQTKSIPSEVFLSKLLKWGQENRRDFPWRNETDPFRILIAELLLQRSRASSVAPIYEQLFQRWKTPDSLARATVDEITQIIKSLGLTERAKTIKSIAQYITETLISFPNSIDKLTNIPGVGRYVAVATIVTAFDANIPLIDSVTARVYRRYFCISPFSKNGIELSTTELDEISHRLPNHSWKLLNWAVLDLAAKICLPKKPRCARCPLSDSCAYSISRNKMTVIELFAGIGGFRIGLEKSNWRVVLSNQWEPGTTRQYASELYIQHFGAENHICADMERVLDEVESGKREISNFELLVGGFPCQDYSVARTLSQATGIQGKKGVLWWQIYRLLSMKRPRLIFLENVDRLLSSPATQRGRDFAIMLSCLSDLHYLVEWRVVNAADYGFPQKRRRVFIIGSLVPNDFVMRNHISLLTRDGVLAKALPVKFQENQPVLNLAGLTLPDFRIDGDIKSISDHFGKKTMRTPFLNTGVMHNREVWTRKVIPNFQRKRQVLREILLSEDEVDETYYVPDTELEKWRYLKGAKNEHRVHKASGFEYSYNEGAIPFPDNLEGPSRTILTAEGGSTPSRFKHIILTPSGKYRRLTPIELERLNGFPDGWTKGIPDARRAFLMGNALVVGIIERIGKILADTLCEKIVAQPDNLVKSSS